MLIEFVEIFLGAFYNFFPVDTWENVGDMQLLAGVVAAASMLVLLVGVVGTVWVLASGCIKIACRAFGGANK